MRIAIPINENNGLESKVFAHFGSAPLFMVFDTDSQEQEIIDNQNANHQHGMCHPMAQLSTKEINCVVCGGMGVRAVQKLNEAGIKAYKMSTDDGTVKDIISQLSANNLTEITVDDACQNHNCH